MWPRKNLANCAKGPNRSPLSITAHHCKILDGSKRLGNPHMNSRAGERNSHLSALLQVVELPPPPRERQKKTTTIFDSTHMGVAQITQEGQTAGFGRIPLF